MKRILSIIAICTTFYTTYVYAEEIEVKENTVEAYAEENPITDYERFAYELKECDAEYEYEAVRSASSVDIIKNAEILVGCYEKLAYKIIDKYYSKNAEEQKTIFKNYIAASLQVTQGSYEAQDFCTPNCGSIAKTEAHLAAADMVRYIMDQYIAATNKQ